MMRLKSSLCIAVILLTYAANKPKGSYIYCKSTVYWSLTSQNSHSFLWMKYAYKHGIHVMHIIVILGNLV